MSNANRTEKAPLARKFSTIRDATSVVNRKSLVCLKQENEKYCEFMRVESAGLDDLDPFVVEGVVYLLCGGELIRPVGDNVVEVYSPTVVRANDADSLYPLLRICDMGRPHLREIESGIRIDFVLTGDSEIVTIGQLYDLICEAHRYEVAADEVYQEYDDCTTAAVAVENSDLLMPDTQAALHYVRDLFIGPDGLSRAVLFDGCSELLTRAWRAGARASW